MAVEASRIVGRFKELFPKANLSNKRLNAIAVRLAKRPADDAEDSAIDEVLNEVNEVTPFDEMAKEEHRLNNAEIKLKKLQAPNPADEEEDTDPPAPPADEDEKIPSWAKQVLATNQKMAQELQELKSGKIIEGKKATATKLFNENEVLKGLKETVKEKWLNRIDVNSETPIEDQIVDLETEYNDLVQVSANEQRYAGQPPKGSANNKPTDAELDAVANGL